MSCRSAIAPSDDANRREDWLIEAVPHDRRKVYDMRKILGAVVDKDSLFEIGRKFGGSVDHGAGAARRLAGRRAGERSAFLRRRLDRARRAQKVTRFVDLANTFHLPVVHLVDVPGFVIGPEAEKAGTIRYGARALAAIYQARVPWCSIIIRKVFGVAGAGHTAHQRLHYRYAWPSGDWGSLPVEGGIEAAYRAELDAAPDRDKLRVEIEERLNRVPLAVSHRRDVPGRGDHRSARHASAAVRIREPHGKTARGGPGRDRDAAVSVEADIFNPAPQAEKADRRDVDPKHDVPVLAVFRRVNTSAKLHRTPALVRPRGLL